MPSPSTTTSTSTSYHRYLHRPGRLDPRRTQFFLDAGPASDIYVAKWTPTGNLVDAFLIGAKKTRLNNAPAAVATPTDRLFLSGGFSGIIDLDPTEQDLFLDTSAGNLFLITYPT